MQLLNKFSARHDKLFSRLVLCCGIFLLLFSLVLGLVGKTQPAPVNASPQIESSSSSSPISLNGFNLCVALDDKGYVKTASSSEYNVLCFLDNDFVNYTNGTILTNCLYQNWDVGVKAIIKLAQYQCYYPFPDDGGVKIIRVSILHTINDQEDTSYRSSKLKVGTYFDTSNYPVAFKSSSSTSSYQSSELISSSKAQSSITSQVNFSDYVGIDLVKMFCVALDDGGNVRTAEEREDKVYCVVKNKFDTIKDKPIGYITLENCSYVGKEILDILAHRCGAVGTKAKVQEFDPGYNLDYIDVYLFHSKIEKKTTFSDYDPDYELNQYLDACLFYEKSEPCTKQKITQTQSVSTVFSSDSRSSSSSSSSSIKRNLADFGRGALNIPSKKRSLKDTFLITERPYYDCSDIAFTVFYCGGDSIFYTLFGYSPVRLDSSLITFFFVILSLFTLAIAVFLIMIVYVISISVNKPAKWWSAFIPLIFSILLIVVCVFILFLIGLNDRAIRYS